MATSHYKQDYMAIKYDYDTQCSMTEDTLNDYIRVLDAKVSPTSEGLGTMSGPYIGRPVPVINGVSVNGITVYYIYDNPYTKMATAQGNPKYYIGPASDQGVINNYPTAGGVPDGSYVYTPGARAKQSDADVNAAFQPIGDYYANLQAIKKRLNKFLEKASDQVVESQDTLVNKERYENRANPQDTVKPRELVFGLFSELRPSSVPFLLAAGVFMSCISILMIFQMFGFTGQINLPPALIAATSGAASGIGSQPFYENPMILSGLVILLGAGMVSFGIMYYNAKQKSQ